MAPHNRRSPGMPCPSRIPIPRPCPGWSSRAAPRGRSGHPASRAAGPTDRRAARHPVSMRHSARWAPAGNAPSTSVGRTRSTRAVRAQHQAHASPGASDPTVRSPAGRDRPRSGVPQGCSACALPRGPRRHPGAGRPSPPAGHRRCRPRRGATWPPSPRSGPGRPAAPAGARASCPRCGATHDRRPSPGA